MDGRKMLNGMSEVNEDLIEESEAAFDVVRKQLVWRKWAVAMVCMCVCIIGSMAVYSRFNNNNEVGKSTDIPTMSDENGAESTGAMDKDNLEEAGVYIDISKIDEDKILESSGSMDMNVHNPELSQLEEKADIIFKGKLISNEAVLEDSMMLSSMYNFKIDDVIKGKVEGENIVVNTPGGIMKKEDYLKRVEELGFGTSEDTYDGKEYVMQTYFGFKPLKLYKEYIIYACINENTGEYYPLYYYYGIFEKSDNSDEYISYSEENEKGKVVSYNGNGEITEVK